MGIVVSRRVVAIAVGGITLRKLQVVIAIDIRWAARVVEAIAILCGHLSSD